MKKSGNEKSQRFIPKCYNSDFFKLNLRRSKIYIHCRRYFQIFVYWCKHNGVWKLGQFLCLCERQSKHFLKISVKLTDSHNITIVFLKTNN